MSAPSHRLGFKVAIITGAGSGIGRAIALAFASHGAKLVVVADLQEGGSGDRADSDPTHVAINKAFGDGKAIFVKTDITSGESLRNAVAKAVELGGRLDVMVNNAGIDLPMNRPPFHEEADDVPDPIFNVNLKGTYLGSKYAIKQFLTQTPDAVGRRGCIVNVASVLAFATFQGMAPAYCASKGGVVSLSKQLAVDYAKDGIYCNALCPGPTRTSMTRPAYEVAPIEDQIAKLHPLGRWARPEEIAAGAVFLASDDAIWVQGASLPVDGGFLAQ